MKRQQKALEKPRKTNTGDVIKGIKIGHYVQVQSGTKTKKKGFNFLELDWHPYVVEDVLE